MRRHIAPQHRTRVLPSGRVRFSVALIVGTLVLAGCGAESFNPEPRAVEPSDANAATERSTGPSVGAARLHKAPAVTVTHGDTTLTLEPWTTCWSGPSSGYCADGMPPEEPPDLGTVTDDITVDFPVPGWDFTAVFRDPGGHCGVSIQFELAAAGLNRWTLPGVGPAGAYEVYVSGRGPEGDVHVTFAARTTADGVMPPPSADLAVVYDIDGVPMLQGPATLGLDLLANPETQPTASVQVTAADGRRTSLDLAPAAQECLNVGSVQLGEGGALEPQTADLVEATERFGPAPYDICVDLQLDGTTHVAQLRNPDDLDPESATLRPLFSPPLPAAAAAAYAPFLGQYRVG